MPGFRGTALTLALAIASTACANAKPTNETPDSGVGGNEPDASVITPDADVESFRVMIFNINHAETSSLANLAAVITSADPDFVGLVDIDMDRGRSGNVDQPTEVAAATGLTKRFFSEVTYPQDGASGDAILTRFPIISSGKILLPNQGGQQRILAWADLDVGGVAVRVGLTHLGEFSAAERLAQAQAVATEMTGFEWGVLVGDLNDVPGSAPVAAIGTKLVDQWPLLGTEPEGLTYPAIAPEQRRDYVFASSAFGEPLDGKPIESKTSDHLPVIIDLPLPRQ